MKLADIEGIGPVYSAKLVQAGIKTPQDLWERGNTKANRRELESITGISQDILHKWVKVADLLRVKGIGLEYVDLLEEVGVDSSKELALRDPEKLLELIIEINSTKKLVRRVPGIGWLEKIIQSAFEINHGSHILPGTQTTPAPAPPPEKKYGPKVE